jgi:hypothetical protein
MHTYLLAAGHGHGNLNISPIALLVIAAVVYFIGRHHGRA